MEKYIEKLSQLIVNYSLRVEEGEKVLITSKTNKCNEFIKNLVNDIIIRGGCPVVKYIDNEISSVIYEKMTEDMTDLYAKIKENEVETFDSFIQILYNDNDYENNKMNTKMYNMLCKKTASVDDIRINKRKWVLLNYPSKLDAYKANMNTEEFYKFAMEVMTIDYNYMNEILKPLKQLMEKTDKVRIVRDDTDLTFSIKNMPAIICAGEYNIPDGEIYTAPVKDSVNGYLTYNTPSPYRNNVFNNIRLEFKDGKIVKATCDGDNDKLNEIFDTDEGSRYIGEFSFGVNPKIKKAMGDILFDEKIYGSIHFTPGKCYENADNGNNSFIHWDLVQIQRPEYGGGLVYFDDVLIRKDGKFVLPELKNINFD